MVAVVSSCRASHHERILKTAVERACACQKGRQVPVKRSGEEKLALFIRTKSFPALLLISPG